MKSKIMKTAVNYFLFHFFFIYVNFIPPTTMSIPFTLV